MIRANGALRFLLAEDDAIDVEALRRAFTRRRITVPLELAGDGNQALARVRESRSRDSWIVILDLEMPRMGGLEFLEALRGDPQLRRTPVFVLSSEAAATDLRRAYDLGIAGYVVKPKDPRDLEPLAELLELYARLVVLSC